MRRLGLLLPCEGLGDFPTFYQGADADELLAGWLAIWRPRLIAAAGRVPEIVCSYQLDDHETPDTSGFAGTLLLVPGLAVEDEVRRWIDEGTALLSNDWLIVESFASQAGVLSAIEESSFAALAADCGHSDEVDYERELAALGFACLQVAMMVGQFADGPAFDNAAFDMSVVAAARAAVAGDAAAFQAALTDSYDRLTTLRTNCYPLDVWLLDTVLVADTTLGNRLKLELADPTPKSIRLTQSLIDQLDDSTVEPIKTGVREQRLAVVAGDRTTAVERQPAWSLLPPEAMADELAAVTSSAEQVAGARPQVFSPWSCQLPARLVQALDQQAYTGLQLGGFDGEYPAYCQHTKAFVTGPGNTRLEAVSRKPHDLASVETYLQWANLLTETLNDDHVATLPLAGWAGCRHPLLDILRRVARRSSVLGQFATLDDYFEQTALAERDATPTDDLLGPSASDPVSHAPVATPAASPSFAAGLAAISNAAGDGSAIERCGATVGGTLGHEPANLFINPLSFPRVCRTSAGDAAIVPGCGFSMSQTADNPTVAAGRALQSLHGAVEIDATSGGIRSLRVPSVRGPLLSQRLVVGTARDSQGWVAMHAERVDSAQLTPSGAALTTTGAIFDRDSKPIARFHQTTTLDTDAAQFRLRIEIEPTDSKAEHRWFASRLLLRDDDWLATRSVQWRRLPCEATSFAASDDCELRTPGQRISMRTSGAIHVRRPSPRTLDALIATRLSEPIAAEFTVGFGDCHPLRAKLADAVPAWAFTRSSSPPPGQAAVPAEGWWLHLDTPNVLVSRIEPAAGGVRVHLIETAGRETTSRLRLWRPLREAVLLGRDATSLPIDRNGAAAVEMPAHGWLRLDLSW